MAKLVFASDTFSGTAGDSLEDPVGTLWVKHTGASSGDIVISDTGRARAVYTLTSVYYQNVTPPSANYIVEAEFHKFTDTNREVGVCARMDSAALTYYYFAIVARSVTDRAQLFKRVAGTITQLGSNYTLEHPLTTNTRFAIEVNGTTINAYIDSSIVITATDSAISSAGFAGIYTGNNSDNATGIHLDNWQAYRETVQYETPNLSIQTSHAAPTYTAISSGLSYESLQLNIETRVGQTSFTGLPEWTNVPDVDPFYETPALLILTAHGSPDYTVGDATDGDGQHPLFWLSNQDWGDPVVNVVYETPALIITTTNPAPEWSRTALNTYDTPTLLIAITQIAPEYTAVTSPGAVQYETPNLVITLTNPLPQYSLIITVPIFGVLFGTDGYAANRFAGTIGDSPRITGEAGRSS